MRTSSDSPTERLREFALDRPFLPAIEDLDYPIGLIRAACLTTGRGDMPASAAGVTPRASILVVEDDPAFARVLTDLLRLDGYQVWLARTGAEAEAMGASVHPQLVLLDLVLPDVDGLLLCARLSARYRVPIIIISGTQRKRDRILGLKLGADDFIAKPFDFEELEARIDAVLRRVRMPSNNGS